MPYLFIALLCVTFVRKYKGNEKVNLDRQTLYFHTLFK